MRAPRRSGFLAMGVGIALVALGLAALSRRSELWRSGVANALLLSLLAGLAGVALARGRARAFWVGFAVFGWGHFLFVAGPWAPSHFPARALTSEGLGALYSRIATMPAGATVGRHGLVFEPGSPFFPGVADLNQDYIRFDSIGHYLATIAIATIFGSTCLLLDGRTDRESLPRP